jgi:cytolysin-activating lysine-acyltransferase
MTWLLTQSPVHRTLTIGDLEWLVMPALLKEQFYLFRDGTQPIGLALWAITDEEGEAKLNRGIVDPGNRLTLEQWSGGERIWLIDLVAPFATAANNHAELMIADLIAGPLRGRAFSFHQTEPATGARTVKQVGADAADKLAEAVLATNDHEHG